MLNVGDSIIYLKHSLRRKFCHFCFCNA